MLATIALLGLLGPAPEAGGPPTREELAATSERGRRSRPTTAPSRRPTTPCSP